MPGLISGAPYVEHVKQSEHGNWTEFTWSLDKEFTYTTQTIQQCKYIVDINKCTYYYIKHGGSARLLLNDGHYDVYLLLNDRDDEVYREKIFSSVDNESDCHCKYEPCHSSDRF